MFERSIVAGGSTDLRRLVGSRRRARRCVAVALAVAACAFGSLTLAGVSGAAGPTKGSNVPGAAAAQGSFTTGPFDSGQLVNIVIPANSVLVPGQKLFILECAAPNGVNPITVDNCDGETNYGNGTILANSDGSVNLKAAGKALYPIYALPDHYSLGETSPNGATCGVGAANECVLYIGQGGGNDVGLSQPYFFSQPFQVHTDPTDSGTLNPGDGSPAPVAPVSPTLSTVTPPTQTVAADGADPATITVTVNDTNSVGVAGKTVSLTAKNGSSTVAPVATGVTDANGQVSFTATDATPETVTYGADDTTDSIALTATAQVVFAPETPNAVASSVTAAPTSVPADGITASTVTVVLRDKPVNGSPQPMSGRTISLSAEGGGPVIAPASAGSNVTNASGQATFSVTDAHNEIVTLKATDTTDSVALNATASITFGTPAPVSASASTVTASPSPAFTGSGNGTMVTVTLLTSGLTPVAAKSVTVSASSASGHAAVSSANPQVTSASGQAVFTVTDTTPESVSISAVDTTDANLKLDATVAVVFKTPPPPTISAQNSQVIVTASPEPADGFSAALVEVIVVNTVGAPMPGVTVTVAASPSGTAQVTAVLTAGGGVTDAHGITEFNVHDTAAETVTLTATAGATPLLAHPTATFLAGPPNASASTVAASPANVAANGTADSIVTVSLKDYFGNAIAGKTMTLIPASGSSVFTPVTVDSSTLPGTTNAQGVARFSVTDATTEVVSYTANDTTDDLNLAQQATVTFGNPPPVLAAMADSDVVVNASKVPADGKTDATITVQLRDANGHPVNGKTVSLAASGGSSVIKVAVGAPGASVASVAKPAVASPAASRPLATTTVVTNSNGAAVFDATDTVPESVTYTADDQTDSMSGWKVTVTFTAATVTTTTTTTTTSTTTPAAAVAASSAGPAASAATGDTGSGTSGTGATDTGTGTTGASSPNLAFTGAPNALPWLIGAGLICLLLGMLGRRILLARRRDQ